MKPVKNEKKQKQNCWLRLNASPAAQNYFAGRMFVTSDLKRASRIWPLGPILVTLELNTEEVSVSNGLSAYD